MNLSNLYLKDETRNPTGSFKDRPISCAISKTKEEGKNTVITSTFLNSFATEGDKTVTYELYQQLGLVPDRIVVPVGAGPLLAGIYKGYKELKQLGLVDRLPAMVAVQARGCAPIVRAFDKGDPEVEPWEVPHTVASGIADLLQGYFEDGTLTLQVIRKSGGVAVAVDDDLIESVQNLSKFAGIFSEPTGASSVASLQKLEDKGILEGGDTVVCPITGSGFKDSYTIEEYIEIPPKEFEADLEEVEYFFGTIHLAKHLSWPSPDLPA